MIWYVFPIKEQMSWEGHLSGLIVGLLFAFIFRKSIAKPKKYEWQKEDYNEDDDPFLKHFDENGNFIENLPEEEDKEEDKEEPKEEDKEEQKKTEKTIRNPKELMVCN